jgi:hypothetical protein
MGKFIMFNKTRAYNVKGEVCLYHEEATAPYKIFDLIKGKFYNNYLGPAIYYWQIDLGEYGNPGCKDKVEMNTNFCIKKITTDDIIEPVCWDFKNFNQFNNSEYDIPFNADEKLWLIEHPVIKEWYKILQPYLSGKTLDELILNPITVYDDTCLTYTFPYYIQNLFAQACIINKDKANLAADALCEAGIKYCDVSWEYSSCPVILGYDRRNWKDVCIHIEEKISGVEAYQKCISQGYYSKINWDNAQPYQDWSIINKLREEEKKEEQDQFNCTEYFLKKK